MVQGTVIGVIGTFVGALVGMFAALNVSAAIAALEGLIGHKFLNADVYFIDYLPSQLQADDVLMVSRRRVGPEFPRHPVSCLACRAHPACGGVTL